MPYERNIETKKALKHDIKAVQAECHNVSQEVDLIKPSSSNEEEVKEEMLSYLDGLRAGIDDSKTPISLDDNLLTAQFLNELQEKTAQVDELTALLNGNLHDLDAETKRLKSQITLSLEAKSRPKSQRQAVMPENIKKAKERFTMMKNELHSLVNTLLPNPDEVMELLERIITAKMDKSSSDYIQLTTENYHMIEMLRGLNVILENPYNKMEYKLGYDV